MESTNPLDQDTWAAMLGLITLPDSSVQVCDETEKEQFFENTFYINSKIQQVSTKSHYVNLWYRFAWVEFTWPGFTRTGFTAKYLPSLVDRILDLPPPGAHRLEGEGADEYPILNIYHIALKFADGAYVAKYIASNKAIAQRGKRLPDVIAERLLEIAPKWHKRDLTRPSRPHSYEGCIFCAVSTLAYWAVMSKDHPIAEDTTTKLVGWLDTWAAYDSWSESMMSGTGANNLPLACFSLSGLLKRASDFTADLKQQRRAFKCLEICALPTCTVETNLKTCVKCKTVAYCSRAHQKDDWNYKLESTVDKEVPHKMRCFETEY